MISKIAVGQLLTLDKNQEVEVAGNNLSCILKLSPGLWTFDEVFDYDYTYHYYPDGSFSDPISSLEKSWKIRATRVG